jgi:hypothetical protein
MDDSETLATVSSGAHTRKIKVRDYKKMLAAKPPDRQAITEMIYHRFYGRFIKPFLFPNNQYRKHYKNGFAMMAASCLLIEALESFRNGWEETPRDVAGDKVFENFFKREDAFSQFRGKQFYKNVRCGLLHQGETTGGFTIQRKGPLINAKKKINANAFSGNLKASLACYNRELLAAEWDSELWDNFRRKMRFIISH